MSRKSRYDIPSKTVLRWRAGAYIRLSREDDLKADESKSIKAQRQLLQKFFEERPEICLADFYVDDGYSGTDLDRPCFRALQDSYENGRVNCVVVKDLSRLARNYEEASNLVKVIFPFYRIRFISINDRIDSFLDPDSVNRLDVSFKNIMNDEYSRDLSKKVRSATEIKRRKGEFLGAFAPFGYQKDRDDHHKLIIDDDAARIVRSIFEEYVRCPNFSRLAQKLTDAGVPCPIAYKRQAGSKLKNNCPLQYSVWNASSIKRILTSEVYLGGLTQQKVGVISYKNHKIVQRPREEWITVKETHEPIVSEELFARVKQLIGERHKEKTRIEMPSLFGKVVRCGNCGYPLSVTNYMGQDRYRAYYCSSKYKRRSNCNCIRIRESAIEEIVKSTLNAYLKIFLKFKTFSENKTNSSMKRVKTMDESDLEKQKRELYLRYKSGNMTEMQYRSERTRLEAAFEQKKDDTMPDQPRLEECTFFDLFSGRRFFKRITKEIADNFIKEIKVYSKTKVEVTFKFADEFASFMQSLEVSKSEGL